MAEPLMAASDIRTWDEATEYARNVIVQIRDLKAQLPDLEQAIVDATAARDNALAQLDSLNGEVGDVLNRAQELV